MHGSKPDNPWNAHFRPPRLQGLNRPRQVEAVLSGHLGAGDAEARQYRRKRCEVRPSLSMRLMSPTMVW
jgi:hypothetical protein